MSQKGRMCIRPWCDCSQPTAHWWAENPVADLKLTSAWQLVHTSTTCSHFYNFSTLLHYILHSYLSPKQLAVKQWAIASWALSILITHKQLLLELSCILGEHSTSFQYQKSCLDLAYCQHKATANKNTETATLSSQATTNKSTDMTKLSTSGHCKYKHCGCLLWQHKHKHKHGDAVNLRLLQTQTLRGRCCLLSWTLTLLSLRLVCRRPANMDTTCCPQEN